ncbi:glycerophosphodiester phosphodiesterase family protein [uncultured Litoreibacter sp.]|uniref:glycerophosphodiester phosphodiesterase family protein n=1 Tax=uncultured Litoreibacter sp. TaxID=1392394 RepID=UPI0026031975|nr:glycerophosphodiester phosphodiesterase family protein [uncultured Litoreibacter sp.]
MTHSKYLLATLCALLTSPAISQDTQVGPRPLYLVDRMDDGALKDKLLSCANDPVTRTAFSIGHRGAALQFPEHTAQSYTAASRMGAGIIECDVTFTSDKKLVCRHAQNDLHTTTNILATELANKCTTPFSPAKDGAPASAECRTSDLTLAEFQTLIGKMDAADSSATTLEGYMNATADWRTDLYAHQGSLMTHAQSIALIKSAGGKFTPELKSPAVTMPFNGFTQEAYAQMMIDEYKAAGIPATDVWAQSFNLDDILYWIKAEPEFGAQAVYLVQWHDGFDEQDHTTWKEDFASLKSQGVNYLAPSMNMLMTNADGELAASNYAKAAREAGLLLISWSLERSGPLHTGGGWYYKSVNDLITSDGDLYEVIDTLAQDVGVVGLFSDWPATVSYYASCMKLP